MKKFNNICTFLHPIGLDIFILREHWERKRPFENILNSQNYKVKESSCGLRVIPTKGRNGTPTKSVTGGGVAIVYSEENVRVEDADIEIPEDVEATWVILTPKINEITTIRKILVGGIYIAPRSQFKQKSIKHIIETMFMVQSRYEFPLHYLVSGDFNKVDTTDIMEFNGALNQICSVPTQK